MYSGKILKMLKKEKVKVGDRIKVIKNGKIFEGILMPRIEMGDQDSLVLKLKNGYNTGIRFEKGIEIEKIKTEWEIKPRKKGTSDDIYNRNRWYYCQ